MSEKRVSVITVTFNAASTLVACIESVLAHKGQDLEFVVIDGASKDGTVAILERYGKAIDVVVTEPDKGIYDAMNKGLDRASGEYVLFLGADDVLLHIPRQELSQGSDLVVGDVDCGGWTFRHLRPEAALRKRMTHRNGIHPQGTFYRKSDIRYSLDYRYCADYLFNVEHLGSATRIAYCNAAISHFCTEGASAGWPAKREVMAIARRCFGIRAGFKSFLYHLGSHLVDSWRRRRDRGC